MERRIPDKIEQQGISTKYYIDGNGYKIIGLVFFNL